MAKESATAPLNFYEKHPPATSSIRRAFSKAEKLFSVSGLLVLTCRSSIADLLIIKVIKSGGPKPTLVLGALKLYYP
jgi:hypothetical protein